MSDTDSDLKMIIEAALFAAEAPLSPRRLQDLFPDDARPQHEEIEKVIGILQQECRERGIELVRTGGGYRYHTRERLAPWLRRLNDSRPPRYSRALLETLAIIAYRQPVTRGEIEEIRGVSVSSDIMRVLQEREWIRQVGVKEVPGRPGLYGTTRAFLEYFNLRGLSDLPALIDQRDMADIARDLNLELPSAEAAAGVGVEGGETLADGDRAGEEDPDSAAHPVAGPRDADPDRERDADAGVAPAADGGGTGGPAGPDGERRRGAWSGDDGSGRADDGDAPGDADDAHRGPLSAATEDDSAVRG